jgi:uncharacterized protein (TIGR01244 family)
MTDIRTVTAEFAVSPQISPDDVAAAAKAGYALIINNRPDGEAPGQPSGAEIEAAARSAGLAYAHIPILGRPSVEQVEAVIQAIQAVDGKTLAFCRSGTRSIIAWALGQSSGRSREELTRLGAAAGYDLSNI